jgi:hypothetical protein
MGILRQAPRAVGASAAGGRRRRGRGLWNSPRARRGRHVFAPFAIASFGFTTNDAQRLAADEQYSWRVNRPITPELLARIFVSCAHACDRAKHRRMRVDALGRKRPQNLRESGRIERSESSGRSERKTTCGSQGCVTAPITNSRPGSSANTPQPICSVWASSCVGSVRRSGGGCSSISRPRNIPRIIADCCRSNAHAAAYVKCAGATTRISCRSEISYFGMKRSTRASGCRSS